jgi:nitroreductase
VKVPKEFAVLPPMVLDRIATDWVLGPGNDLLTHYILAAGTAPNGANRQPWHFVVVSDPDVKRQIRVAAEREERIFYQERATLSGSSAALVL